MIFNVKKKKKVALKDKCEFGNDEQVTYAKVLFN